MLLPYLLELSKVNACVTRLNHITQNNGGCFYFSSYGNARAKKYPSKLNCKLPNTHISCRFISNEYVLHKSPFNRTWSTYYFTRYTPCTKKQRTRHIIVRFFKSGNQPAIAPLYPTKYKCFTKIPEAVNVNEDLTKERGIPIEKIRAEMRKIAFKIKKDQWSSRPNVPSPRIQHSYNVPNFKSPSFESSKFLGKGWTENNNKVIFESESLKNLKKRISKKKFEEPPVIKLPVPISVEKTEPEKPPSPYLFVSDSNVNTTENNSQSTEKNDSSSLPSPYFFIKKKFNQEILTGTHSNPTIKSNKINEKVNKVDAKKDHVDDMNNHVPSPRLLQRNPPDDYFDDPNVLRRRIDSALKHSFTKKNTLEVLSSVTLTKDNSSVNGNSNKKVVYPSPNLKEYSKLFLFRDEVPQPQPDTFSIKMISASKNIKKSSSNIGRSKSDLPVRFDDYLRRLDKNIRKKTKALTKEDVQKDKVKQINISTLNNLEKVSLNANQTNKFNINSNFLKSTDNNSSVNLVESKPVNINSSIKVIENQTDLNVQPATEEVIDNEIKNVPQRVKKNIENSPLLIDNSRNKINSVLKKGIHSKSSINSSKKDADSEFDQWKPISNDELRSKNYDINNDDRQTSKDKVTHLFAKRIIEVSSPHVRLNDERKRLVKPIIPKEEINVEDRFNIEPIIDRNQSNYVDNSLRHKRTDDQLNSRDYNSLKEPEILSHEPNLKRIEVRENPDFEEDRSKEPYQKYIPNNRKPEEIDNQIHSEPRINEDEKELIEAKFEPENWQGNSNRRQAVLGQSAPYYPHFSRVEANLKDDSEEIEKYIHSDHQDDRNMRIRHHKNIPIEDDTFYENKDDRMITSRNEKDNYRYELPQDEKVWRTVKPDLMGSDQKKHKFESTDDVYNKEFYYNTDKKVDYHDRSVHHHKIKHDNPEGVSSKNDFDNEQIDFLTASEISKQNQLSDSKGDILIKRLPSSQFLSPNERSAISEYDPDPFNEALARRAVLNEEELNRNEDTGRRHIDSRLKSHDPDQYSHMPKRSTVNYSKDQLEDDHLVRTDSIRKQRNRQFDEETEIRNAKEGINRIDDFQSRDKEMFDKNELIKGKVKRNRDVFMESEIRERLDNQPFEYTLAEESKKSFDELKKMVKNELVMDRNRLQSPNSNEKYEALRENKLNEHDFHKKNIARREKQDDLDSQMVDRGKAYTNYKHDDATALKSHNRKYLTNSYYHLGKAKSSLEKYLENLKLVVGNPETDRGNSGFSNKNPSEYNFDRSQSKSYPTEGQEAIKRQKAKSRMIKRKISEEDVIYKRPKTMKQDMRNIKYPKNDQDEYIRKSNRHDAEEIDEYQPQRTMLRPGQHRWESSEINKAAPKLHQKNSEWYNQYKYRIDPYSRNRSEETPLNDGNTPNDPIMVNPQATVNADSQSFSQSSYPKHYYSRTVNPRQMVKSNQVSSPVQSNSVSRSPNYVHEHYKEYFNKPNSTGAIDTIPPYLQNDAYYYGEEPKVNHTENYSQFKNLNTNNLNQNNQGGARRNSHTIVSPSPFFSNPYEFNPNVNQVNTDYQNDQTYSNIPEYLAPENNYEESTNLNSKRINSNQNNFIQSDQGKFVNEGVYPSNYYDLKQNQNYSNIPNNERVNKYQSKNYSLGIDQLLTSDESSRSFLKNKYLNSFGMSNRPEQFSDNYRNADMTEPSYVFSKVPAMFNSTSRGFSLLDVPKHLSGYFNKLVKWKNLRDYKYSSSDSVYNLNTEAYYKPNDKQDQVIDVPLTKEGRLEKLTKPLTPIINRINRNVNSYYIKNSIPNHINSISNVNHMRNINSDFSLENDSLSPSIKVSKISLNLKNTFPFLKNKKRKFIPKNYIKKPIVPKKEETNVKNEESINKNPSEITESKNVVEDPAINQLSREQNNSKQKPDETVSTEPLSKPSVPNKPTVSLPVQEQKATDQPPLETNTKKDAKTKVKMANIFKLVRKNYEVNKNKDKKSIPQDSSSKLKTIKVGNPKQNFLSKLMILKPKKKQPITKLQALSLSQKKSKVGQKESKLITKVETKSNELENKLLSQTEPESDNKNISLLPSPNMMSVDNQINRQNAENKSELLKDHNMSELASDISNKKDGINDMKLEKNINVDQRSVVLPRKKTRSKTMLNVLKRYTDPQRKKNPYKAFSDLYSD